MSVLRVSHVAGWERTPHAEADTVAADKDAAAAAAAAAAGTAVAVAVAAVSYRQKGDTQLALLSS